MGAPGVLSVSRHVPFTEVFNFRDLGGYTTADGRTVLWRRLYRSDSLHRLAGDDRETFASLGIRTVLDLRRPTEIARDGRVPEQLSLTYRHIHPEHPEWRADSYDEVAGVARYLADRYLELAEEGAVGLAAAIGVIADAGTAPLVMHCVAGKDRTGVVSALSLELLGVSDVDIAEDYALTRLGERRYSAWLRRTDPARAALTPPPRYYTMTPPEAMLAFLADLRARYGSVRRYLTEAGGLPPEQVTALRAHLLSVS
jgi:protein-tyrosine phosphatase